MDVKEREMFIERMKEAYEDTVLSRLGLTVETFDPDELVVQAKVGKHLFQPAGIVHGGVYVLMAESAASIAAGLSINLKEEIAFGMEINANHIRPVSRGTLRATARPLHRGRSSHIYDIKIVDDEGRLVSISRCTMAIRKRRQEHRIEAIERD